MIGVHLCLGAAVLIGGENRFVRPTYQPLIDMVGGQTWIWGVWTAVAAVLMMVPLRWPNIVGLWLGMAWQIMWMVLFGIALVHYPNAAATPMVAYGGFAMIDAALLTARVMDHKKE